MNRDFKLLEAFETKDFIFDLPLSRVLMEDKEFPWILLIPRVPGICQINHLSKENRLQLMDEISIASDIMEKIFPTDILNVATIGNKTPQLHVHIISRIKDDSLWPEPIWGKDMKKLSESERADRAQKIRKEFESYTRLT